MVSLPNPSFTPGSVIRSTEVTGNFNALVNYINGSINTDSFATFTGAVQRVITSNVLAESITSTSTEGVFDITGSGVWNASKAGIRFQTSAAQTTGDAALDVAMSNSNSTIPAFRIKQAGSGAAIQVLDDDDNVVLEVLPDGSIAQAGFVGTIITSVSETVPPLHFYCDGSAKSRTEYAELFDVIGTRFGDGDGSTTFNLPDFRGYFLRGQNDGAGVDPDAATRRDVANNVVGDEIGSIQTDATKRPNTNFTTGNNNTSLAHSHTQRVRGGTPGSSTRAELTHGGHATEFTEVNNTANSGNLNHTHTVTGGGDAETRPVNVAVRYYIRYR